MMDTQIDSGRQGTNPPPASAAVDRRTVGAIALVAAALIVAFWDVLQKLVLDWSQDENYSHGFLIIPLAAYLTWERRARIQAQPVTPSWFGLLVVLAGLGSLAAGTLGVELFVSRVSLLIVLAGCVLFLGGWGHLRLCALPIAVLVLMIPVPALVFNKIALPLQFIASGVGEFALQTLRIPVLRQGNVIVLANGSLEVAEACSGIRSLMSLFTLSVVYAYFGERRRSVQILLLVATVPIAILTNGLRVALLGVTSAKYGPKVAESVFHSFSGWVLFALALACLFALHRITLWRPFNTLHQPRTV